MEENKHDTETALIEAIQADTTDDSRAVYADWLEEQGHANRAEYIRLDLRIHALDENDPMRGELQRRLDRMKVVLDAYWMERVARPKESPAEKKRVRVDVRPGPPAPRPRPIPVTLPEPSTPTPEPGPPRIPMRSFGSQMLGLDDQGPSLSARRCRQCGVAIARSASNCHECGAKQSTLWRNVLLLFVFVAVAIIGIDELRWQMKDDNYVTGRGRGCSR